MPNKEIQNKNEGIVVTNNRLLPKSSTDFRTIVAALQQDFERVAKATGTSLPRGISALAYKTFERMRDIALRDNYTSQTYVKCPKCGKKHTVVCSECGNEHDIEVFDAVSEKNSMAALSKLADKFAPNLSSVTATIHFDVVMAKLKVFMVKIIGEDIPQEKRIARMSELNRIIADGVQTIETDDIS